MDSRPILLVEDNPDDIELTLLALTRNKIPNKVVVARDGIEALDLLLGRASHEGDGHFRPSVVLLDLKLPKVDGFEVLKEMRSHRLTKIIPVVILSSSMDESDLQKGYLLGANSYIRKPVDYQQFLTALHTLGTYWLSLNEATSAE